MAARGCTAHTIKSLGTTLPDPQLNRKILLGSPISSKNIPSPTFAVLNFSGVWWGVGGGGGGGRGAAGGGGGGGAGACLLWNMKVKYLGLGILFWPWTYFIQNVFHSKWFVSAAIADANKQPRNWSEQVFVNCHLNTSKRTFNIYY